MSAEFAALVRSFVDEDLVVVPGDPEPEIRANTVWFSVPAGVVEAEALADALRFVRDELRRRFANRAGPLTFYAWYDEQAGQLRCSVASAPVSALPFGGRYVAVDDPAEVVARLVADDSPGRVLWENLEEIPLDEPMPDDQDWPPFPVFAAALV